MAGLSGAVLPILGIVAAVVALVAIGTYLKNHWTEIKEFFVTTWNNIKVYFEGVWTSIKEVIFAVWEYIKSNKDKSTTEVFGNYIDVYDMTQAVEDGATRPVYYESRVIHLKLDESVLEAIDNEYMVMEETVEYHVIERSKKELGRMDSILGAEQTLNALVDDIIDHYENNRAQELTGKAMIVAYSRPIAMKIYHKILEKRPNWTEKVGVVMTSGNNDPEEWHDIIGNKSHKDEMAKKLKNDDDPFKLAIVVDQSNDSTVFSVC